MDNLAPGGGGYYPDPKEPLYTFEDFSDKDTYTAPERLPYPEVPRVFFAQKAGQSRDISSAEKFGQPYFIFDKRTATSTRIRRVEEFMQDFFAENFRPDIDFIALSGGDPATPMIVAMTLMRLFPETNIPYIRWKRYLSWDEDGVKSTFNGYVRTEGFSTNADMFDQNITRL